MTSRLIYFGAKSEPKGSVNTLSCALNGGREPTFQLSNGSSTIAMDGLRGQLKTYQPAYLNPI